MALPTDGEPIYRFTNARNNAELIVLARMLGYIPPRGRILDPTYGKGRFWSLWAPWALWGPEHLIKSDLKPRFPDVLAHDFTKLPHQDRVFDAVVFDPPYKLNGTPTPDGPDADYGVDVKMSTAERHDLCARGIVECARVTANGGFLLIKCQDQVASNKVHFQTHDFAALAEQHGCGLVDMLHLPSKRAQPTGRRQLHAHANYSTLLICRKGYRRPIAGLIPPPVEDDPAETVAFSGYARVSQYDEDPDF